MPFYLPASHDPEIVQPAGFTDWKDERPPIAVDMLGLLDELTIRSRYRLKAARGRFRNPELVTIAFDVRRNLDRQLDEARAILLGAREYLADFIGHEVYPRRKKKIQAQQFPVYIRSLDAEATGARVPEIAAVLYPHEDNTRGTGFVVSAKVRANLKAAKALRDGGYWEMN